MDSCSLENKEVIFWPLKEKNQLKSDFKTTESISVNKYFLQFKD